MIDRIRHTLETAQQPTSIKVVPAGPHARDGIILADGFDGPTHIHTEDGVTVVIKWNIRNTAMEE